MGIRTNGNVGIGLAVPTNKLHVAGGISATAFMRLEQLLNVAAAAFAETLSRAEPGGSARCILKSAF